MQELQLLPCGDTFSLLSAPKKKKIAKFVTLKCFAPLRGTILQYPLTQKPIKLHIF